MKNGDDIDAWIEPSNELMYQDCLIEDIKTEEVTIFANIFSPCGSFLVCGSGYGTIAIWEITPFLEESCWQAGTIPDLKPQLKFSAVSSKNIVGEGGAVGAIYTLAFAGSGDELVLVAGHDVGIHCWRWKDILTLLEQDMLDDECPEPCLMLNCPQQIGYLGSLSPLCEVNGVAASADSTQIYAAAGDGNAYCWDLMTGAVVNTFTGHKDYLQCVAIPPRSNMLVTGSEDGRVGIWDCRSSGTVDFISMKNCGQSKKKNLPGWVAALDVDEGGNWVVCGGGRDKGSFLQTEGFVGTIQLASRCQVNNGRSAVANVQSIKFWEDGILVAGSCRSLGMYDRFCTKKRSKVPINLSSAFSIGKCPGNNIFAVSGSSPAVDIFIHKSSRAFSLQFD